MTKFGGQCRCGEVRFEVSGPPILTSACHCTDCQRMTAGPYSLSALYAEERFALLAGNVVIGQCNSAGQHHFCDKCHSWIYTRPGGIEHMVNVRTPLLDRAAEFLPFAEFFCKESLPGTESGSPLSFDTAPPVDEFLKLAEQYGEWGGRPE